MTNVKPIQNHRQEAIQKARQYLSQKPVYLDTETTGVSRSDEIVEISIVDDEGSVKYETLVRPLQNIPAEASAIHGITQTDVQNAPSWPVIWPTLRTHLVGGLIGIYNAEFDLRLMQQTHSRHKLPWKENLKTFCIMRLYAQFVGEWDPVHIGYRLHSLDKAGKVCGISIPNAHRASTDSLLARALLHYMADSQFEE